MEKRLEELETWRRNVDLRLDGLETGMDEVRTDTRIIRGYFEGATRIGTFVKRHKSKGLYIIMVILVYTGYINPEQAVHIKSVFGL